MPTDLNQSLHDAAAKPSREAPLSAIETRLRRRRRLRQGAIGVCAVALVGALGGGIALSTGDGPNIQAIPPAAAASATAGDPPITFELPNGWGESPVEPGLRYDQEVFTVGTALQPTGIAHNQCLADLQYQDDVFVMLREFTAVVLLKLALDPEPGISSIATLDFPDRPADFATVPREGGRCFPDIDRFPNVENPVFSYRFQDGGRMFIADVTFGSESSPERQAEAFAVLNSLVMSPITVIPEPVATTVPVTVPASADSEAITAAFLGWIDTRPIDASGVYIEDFASIRDAVIGAAEANGHPDEYTGRVEAITRIGENDADVIYSFIIDGQAVVANLGGHAVKIDGVWLVSRDTVCEALLMGPVHCPERI